MLVRIANSEDPDETDLSECLLLFQEHSDLGLHCLSKLFHPVTSV